MATEGRPTEIQPPAGQFWGFPSQVDPDLGNVKQRHESIVTDSLMLSGVGVGVNELSTWQCNLAHRQSRTGGDPRPLGDGCFWPGLCFPLLLSLIRDRGLWSLRAPCTSRPPDRAKSPTNGTGKAAQGRSRCPRLVKGPEASKVAYFARKECRYGIVSFGLRSALDPVSGTAGTAESCRTDQLNQVLI